MTVNGNYYYLDPSNGKMAANTTLTINGVSYTFNANGVYQAGGSSAPTTGNNAPTTSFGGPGGSGSPGGSTNSTVPGGTGGPTSGNPSSGNPSSGSSSQNPGGSSGDKTLKEGLTGGPGTYH